MSRSRIIAANKAVYSSTTGILPSFFGFPVNEGLVSGSGMHARQLNRIDNMSFSVDLAGARTDIREFGQLARIASLRTSDLNPSISIGYFLTNGRNEHELGLNISGMANDGTLNAQIISGTLAEDAQKRSKNIYVNIAPEGQDAFNLGANHSNNNNGDSIAFGDCQITNYSVALSVGEIPRADVEFDASNILFQTGHNSGTDAYAMTNPALDSEGTSNADTGQWALPVAHTGDHSVDVLQHGDITVTFGDAANGLNIGGAQLSNLCIQSCNIDLPLSRTPIECLGQDVAASKPLDTPIEATMSISAFLRDFTTGSLQQIYVNAIDGQKQDITVALANRSNTSKTELAYVLKDAVLDSQGFDLGLDGNETVDLQFSAQVAGADSSSAGLFCSGQYVWDTTGLAIDPSFYLLG